MGQLVELRPAGRFTEAVVGYSVAIGTLCRLGPERFPEDFVSRTLTPPDILARLHPQAFESHCLELARRHLQGHPVGPPTLAELLAHLQGDHAMLILISELRMCVYSGCELSKSGRGAVAELRRKIRTWRTP